MTKRKENITKAVFKLDEDGFPKFYMDFMPAAEAEEFAAKYGAGFVALTYGEYIARQDPDDESEVRQRRRIHGKKADAPRAVVISGAVPGHTRDSAKAVMERAGYIVTSEVTSKTAILITGDKPGPAKVAKAAKLGIRVATWESVAGVAA